MVLHEFFSQLQEQRTHYAAYYGSCLTTPLGDFALRRLTRVSLPHASCVTLDGADAIDCRRRARQHPESAARADEHAARQQEPQSQPPPSSQHRGGSAKLLHFFDNVRQKLALLGRPESGPATQAAAHLFLLVDQLRVDGDAAREFLDALLRVNELRGLERVTVLLASNALLAAHGVESRFSALDTLVFGAYGGATLQRLLVQLCWRASTLAAAADADALKALAGAAKLFVDVAIVQTNDVSLLSERFNAMLDELLEKAQLPVAELRERACSATRSLRIARALTNVEKTKSPRRSSFER